MSIKVECTVPVHELNGKDVSPGDERPKIIVRSHWNRDRLVVLRIGDQEYTVTGRELIAAVENAMRTSRY